MLSFLLALALSPCQVTPDVGEAPIPAFAKLPKAATWPCQALGPPGQPVLIAVHVPSNAAMPAGLWLRAFRGEAGIADRIHRVNSVADQPLGSGCPRGGGQAVDCFRTSATARWPMLAFAHDRLLWVVWVRREVIERHGLSKTDRGPSDRTRLSTKTVDQLLAAPIAVGGRQWMQGPMRTRTLPEPIPDGVAPTLTLRRGVPAVQAGATQHLIDQRYFSDTGALLDRSAFPPKPPPPPPEPQVCRSEHQEDCGSGCVDKRTSRKHCGDCGNDCGKFACQGGECGPFCYTDAHCVNVLPGYPRGRCYTPLVRLRGIPDPQETKACAPGDCGPWERCQAGECAPIKCRTRKDCPRGRVRCLRSGEGGKICVPRGQCVGHFKVP